MRGKRKRAELTEAAQVILAELYQVQGRTAKGLSRDERLEPAGAFGELQGLETPSRRSTLDNFATSDFSAGGVLNGQEPSRRTERREFLNPEIQRRRTRKDHETIDTDRTSPGGRLEAYSSENIGDGELSARMSEQYCRDARRYDGAFERF